MEVWQNSAIVFDGKIIRLRTGEVMLDNGAAAYREVVEHPGGACVLPFTGEAFVFIRQFRIALGQHLIEAPAGKLELGETPRVCAEKELREETGYVARQLTELGAVYPTVGFCNEIIHLFLADGLSQVGRCLEPEERLESLYISIGDVRDMALNNAFSDGKTAIIVQRALNWLDSR